MKFKKIDVMGLLMLVPFIFSVIYSWRFLLGNYSVVGEKAYYYVLSKGGVFGRLISLNPYPYFVVFLSVIFCLVSLFFYAFILKELKVKGEKIYWAVALIMTSPVFIYSFVAGLRSSFVVAMMTILLYLWFRLKKDFKSRVLGSFLIIGLSFLYAGLFEFWPEKGFLLLFSDVGSSSGFNFFFLVLGFLGVLSHWKKRRGFYYIYLLIIFLFISSIFISVEFNFYLIFIWGYFASLGLIYLWRRKWGLKSIKWLSVLIIILSLLLSSLMFIQRAASALPNDEIKESLFWLREEKGGKVFSHPSKSFWIEYYSGQRAYNGYFDKDFEEKMKMTEKIFHLRLSRNTTGFLEENNITYLWIDSQMKKDIWGGDREKGLLFIFRNERFKNVYDKNGVEIWEFEKNE